MIVAEKTASLALPTNLTTVAEFEKWEHQQGREGSYEFSRGRIIEKTDMKQAEFFILKFLARLFLQTASHAQGDELAAEMDSYVDGSRKRRPDLAYYTAAQIEATRTGEWQKTRFAIEILSDSESYDDVLEKIQDYFDAGAQLVWYIVPNRQKIYVYTSPDTSQAYKGTDVISAAPVVPDFTFTVSALFA